MKYFIDTEFLEGPQDKRFLGLKYGKTKPTIDLISIAIVEEDKPTFSNRAGFSDSTIRGREYYAISKDFNLREAWNRYNLKVNKHYPKGPKYIKEYWIRENVIIPILKELAEKEGIWAHGEDDYFTYKIAKKLINKYGKTNEQIAQEIRNFIMAEKYNSGGMVLLGDFYPNEYPEPEFYAYYADYDWVGFCWLFGRMIDLPKGFPMYCRDLKQISDEKYIKNKKKYKDGGGKNFISKLSNHPDYPKQSNEHNALDDARWNKKLYKFLNDI